MIFRIDFESDEALYLQIRNQIIMGIANDLIHEGESLPSVRQMAEYTGINMHMVNKAYGILRDEGIVIQDGRRGTLIRIDVDKLRAIEELDRNMRIVLAKAVCKNVSREEAHQVLDRIYDDYVG